MGEPRGLSPCTEADENTGISTYESLPALSLRAFAGGNPINTSPPKVLTSHPPGLGVGELASELGGRRKRGVETRGRPPASRIHVPPFGKIISYSF